MSRCTCYFAGFDEIEDIQVRPGIYEIFTSYDLPLKVGIASNLRSRLKDHGNSRSSGLKISSSASSPNPSDVSSKKSILAKHLYFDSSLSSGYDFRYEVERQEFLLHDCYILFSYTRTRDLARKLEFVKEKSGAYRYIGPVRKR